MKRKESKCLTLGRNQNSQNERQKCTAANERFHASDGQRVMDNEK